MCLGEEKRLERELKRQAEINRLMPLTGRETPLSCLMCRRCVVTSETSFDDSVVRIYCERIGRMRPARLNPDCPIADPRPARPKHLHRLWVSKGDLGDRAGASTDFLLLYLRHFWQTACKAQLEFQTGRSTDQLRNVVKRYGIGGVGKAHRIAHSGRTESRQFFTPQQTAWLERIYGGELWPRVPTFNKAPDDLATIQKQQQWILDTLLTMGPRWEWVQVLRHLDKRRAVANRKRRQSTLKVAA